MRLYSDTLTAEVNRKGVLDVDVVKGCTSGMAAHKSGGCYDACYAATIAKFRGIDFSVAITRKVHSHSHAEAIEQAVKSAPLGFFRIGTMGDPSHDWPATVETVEWLSPYAVPVIVTKHWQRATDDQFARLVKCGTIINTSISALDTPAELMHRERQLMRYARVGGDSVARVVSCDFNTADPLGQKLAAIQARLLALSPVIDNPLRIPSTHRLVRSGIVRLKSVRDLTAVRPVSVADDATYLGHCDGCPDQCGLSSANPHERPRAPQGELFF